MKPTPYSLTSDIRDRVRVKLGGCPTCGYLSGKNHLRTAAAQIGIAHSSLWRFLNGKSLSSDVLDKVVRWLKVSLRE